MTWPIFLSLCVGAAISMSILMMVAWRAERATGNAGWIDVVWTASTGLVSVAGSLPAYLLAHNPRALVVSALIAIWSLRLGTHIVARTRSKADDPRYAKLRAEMGSSASSGMLRLCQSQAIVSVPMVVSVILAAWNPSPALRFQDVLAVFVLALAVGGEALADAQLKRFQSNPVNRGRICDVGLWRYSRHPNYFFEWMMWLTWPLFAIDLSGEYIWGWFALAGPLCMYWLLNFVSGVPPLEEIMAEKHGAKYVAYQRRTSAFFPMPPAA